MPGPDIATLLAPLAAFLIPAEAALRLPNLFVQQPTEAAPRRPRADRPRAPSDRPVQPRRRDRWSDVLPFAPASFNPTR